MAKITIYVSDERKNDLDRWADKLNFSRLFMDAFDRAVAAQPNVSDVRGKVAKAVVSRLKKAAGAWFEAGRREGADVGYEWAMQHSSLSHLREVATGQTQFGKGGRSARAFLRFFYPESYNDSWFPAEHPLDVGNEEGVDEPMFADGFNTGFVEGVSRVWDVVKAAF